MSDLHDFAKMQCPTCGILYWVPERWDAEKRRTNDTAYCPNGHTWTYTFKSRDEDKGSNVVRLVEED